MTFYIEYEIPFYIEYEIPPFRMIDTTSIKADSEEEAVRLFKLSHSGAKIRKIEGYYK